MFISLRSHNLITECLRNRIAELEAERDFYRARWTERQGVAFKVADVEAEQSSFSKRSSELHEASIDAAWTPDDRDLFENWRIGNVANGEDALEVWQRKYGAQAPLMALTV